MSIQELAVAPLSPAEDAGMRHYLGRLSADAYEVEEAARELELRTEARQAQERAAAILECITDGFVAMDREWRLTQVNAEAERISGIRRQDQIGKCLWDLFPSMRGTLLESQVRRAAAEQVPLNFEYHYEPSDSWFHVKAYPSHDGSLSIFFHDMTMRKRSDESLRKTREELERRVAERTHELSRVNARLARQIARRKRLEEARADLRRRLLHAQEEEHRRIARELHDDLTQRLAVLAIEVGSLEHAPACPQDTRGKLAGVREQLAALSESVHSLSRRLHPSILDDLGLVDALRSECLSFDRRDRIPVEYRAHNVPRGLPRHVAVCVYRVAQEALRNIARHARSSRASVRLATTRDELVLRVRDWGVGFAMPAPGKSGLGLESMRERAHHIAARLIVRSRLGVGTQVTIRVPLKRSHP